MAKHTHEVEADGFVVIHNPPDGGGSYAVGPFPPLGPEFEKLVVEGTSCPCAKLVMELGFPAGIKMGLVLEGGLQESVEALMRSIGLVPESDGRVH